MSSTEPTSVPEITADLPVEIIAPEEPTVDPTLEPTEVLEEAEAQTEDDVRSVINYPP